METKAEIDVVDQMQGLTIEALSHLDLKKQKDQALAVFLNGGIDILKQELQAQFDAFVPDVSTLAGREAIKTHSFKFSKDKTLVDGIGLALIEEEKDIVNRVHASCRDWRDFCDEKRKMARQPLTEYEEVAKAEKERLAKIAQEAQDKINREYAAMVANLASNRLQTLLLILGDEYNAESFGDAPLGTMQEEAFQEMVKEAKATAFEELQAKESERLEAERVEKEEKAKLAEAERRRLVHAARVDILIARGFKNRVFPRVEVLESMSDQEFRALLDNWQTLEDEFKADQVRIEEARKAEHAKQEAAKAKALLGRNRLHLLHNQDDVDPDCLSDMTEEEFRAIMNQDREDYTTAITAQAARDAERARQEKVWTDRICLLNRLRSTMEVSREKLTAMSEEDWQALYSTEKKKVEDAEAEKARVKDMVICRLRMLVDAGSPSRVTPEELAALDESQWTAFFNMEVRAIADVKAAEEKRIAEAKAKNEKHVNQVNKEVVIDLEAAFHAHIAMDNGCPIEVFLCTEIANGNIKHVFIKY